MLDQSREARLRGEQATIGRDGLLVTARLRQHVAEVIVPGGESALGEQVLGCKPEDGLLRVDGSLESGIVSTGIPLG
jgi:hypothetical protein